MSCIIHIGHGKTGTSSIQSYLAGATDELEVLGINYSHHPSFDYATDGQVTSGNGKLILEDNHIIKPNSLYSNEGLFWNLSSDEAIKQLLRKTPDKLKVILYTRDLFDYCSSAWGQAIKKRGYTGEYNAFLKTYASNNTDYNTVEYWIGASTRFEFDLQIFNYSRHRKNLIPHFLNNVLGVASEKLLIDSPINNKIVNRSLSRCENEFIRQINKYAGATTIGDTLVHRLPNVASEAPSIDIETYEFVVNSLTPVIYRINKSLSVSESIKLEKFEDLVSNTGTIRYEFSQEQLESLAEGISKQIIGIDANKLRDIALKYDNKSKLDVSDALFLMSLAKQAKPMGPLILRKVDEYTSTLANKSLRSAPNINIFFNHILLHLKQTFNGR